MLKFLQEFSEAAFLGVAMKSPPDTASILSGLTIDLTRVSDQQVHNSWSDHCIVLKFLQEFTESVFLGVAMKSLLDAPNIWLGQTTNQTRMPA
jgi:hypothetical protein